MTIEDDSEPPDTRRMVLQTVAVIAALGVFMWLVKGNGASTITSLLRRPRSATAPAVTLLPSRGPDCQASQLEITGALSGCADPVIENPLACRVDPVGGVFSGLAHVQDKQHRYVVLVAVDGGYEGAGTYALMPWGQALEGAGDGLTKVLVQQDGSGSQWRSTAGSLTINADGKSGSILADLNPTNGAPGAPRRIRIDGPWHC